jgi:hypothetical protein
MRHKLELGAGDDVADRTAPVRRQIVSGRGADDLLHRTAAQAPCRVALRGQLALAVPRRHLDDQAVDLSLLDPLQLLGDELVILINIQKFLRVVKRNFSFDLDTKRVYVRLVYVKGRAPSRAPTAGRRSKASAGMPAIARTPAANERTERPPAGRPKPRRPHWWVG